MQGTARIAGMTGRDVGRLLLLALIWGGSFYLIAVAVPHVPALTIVVLRCAIGAAVLAAVLGPSRLPRGARAWVGLAALGLVNTALPFVLIVTAQQSLPSSLAAILNATTPLFTVAVAQVATRDERATPARIAGVAVGFAGVAVMLGGAVVAGGGGSALPYLLSLAAAACYAMGSVGARRLAARLADPNALAFGQLFVAAVALAPLMAAVDRPWTLPVPPVGVVAALAALGLVCTGFAYMLYFRILAAAGATAVSTVTFLVPVSAILLGVILLDERLEARHVAGFALIAAGLALIDGRVLRRAGGG